LPPVTVRRWKYWILWCEGALASQRLRMISVFPTLDTVMGS
jgi:hypothetical protein